MAGWRRMKYGHCTEAGRNFKIRLGLVKRKIVFLLHINKNPRS